MPRALVTSSGCPPGTMPRPMPLVIDREPSLLDEPQRCLLRRVGPDVGAQDEHRPLALGRAAPAIRVERIRVRLGPLRRPTGAGRRPRLVEELVHRHVDEDRAAVRRAGEPEGVVEPRRRPRRRSAIVRALLVIVARIGGWSNSWRLPLPQRFCGARPPTTTSGDPANCACAIGADAVGDTRTGGQHREPGRPGQLAGRLGGEHRGLLVAYVEDPHRRDRP